MKKHLFTLLAAGLLGITMTTAGVFAATVKSETKGIEISIETDKDSYVAGDSIGLNVAIANTSSYNYTDVGYTITLPEGVSLVEGQSQCVKGLVLAAGSTRKINNLKTEKLLTSSIAIIDGEIVNNETVVLDATDVIDEGKTPTTSDETCTKALIAVAVASMGTFIIVFWKKRKEIGSGILAVLIIFSGVYVMPANAEETQEQSFAVTATKTISIEGKEQNIVVEVTVGSKSVQNIGIHDPSIFYDPVSGEYYSYGSHIIAGNSEDLVSWRYEANSAVGYGTTNQLFEHHYLEEFAEVYEWLGDGVKEGIWALDVTYSEKAAQANKAPYFMYVTVTDASRAAICLATSDKPEGPFAYQEMIVCSDFRESELDKVNLLDVLGVKDVSELSEELREYYITENRTQYRSKFPDCIDAAPYYDGEGNMYMTYGSFSSVGGLRVLKLDPLTGLRADDNYTYNPDELQDPYYGRQIAVKRGEGPYILTVPSEMSSTGYYYFLFWSQGVLSSTGGYNMRMLRSEYPDRGFVDYSGKSALDSSVVGVRIMDNFMFTTMEYSSTANGGNSAIVTEDGKIFLHYHSKSAQTEAYGPNGFIIKSNQMFLNEDGWLVTTPYKYNGETITELTDADIAGDYEFIYHTLTSKVHPTNIEDNYVSSEFIRLNADKTVTGDYTGTWSNNENYLTITIGGKTYKGVVLEQYDESETREKTIVFTAEGTDNRTVWGSKIGYTNEKRTSIDLENLKVTEVAESDFTLETTGRLASDITWTSNNDAIIIEGSNAKVVRQDYEQTITLRAYAKFGDVTVTKDFTVIVPEEEFDIPTTLSMNVISLPEKTQAGKDITWTSSDSSVINVETGEVNVPENTSVKVTITGVISGSDKVITKEITVMPLPTTVVYSENYDALESLDASLVSSLWYSKNAAASVSLVNVAEGGKYVQFAPARNNSRGAISTFPQEAKATGIYVLDFDLALTAGDNQTTEFAVTTENMAYTDKVVNNGIASGYIFKLSATNSTTWTINDSDAFELAKGEWVHVNVLTDTESEIATVTITDGNNNVIYKGTVKMNNGGALEGFYVRGGRYNSVTAVDNITIKQ